MRDSGPTFVVDERGSTRGVDWIFNAWGGHAGGLYSPWDRDDEVARKVAEIENATATVRRSSWRAVRSTSTGRAPA